MEDKNIAFFVILLILVAIVVYVVFFKKKSNSAEGKSTVFVEGKSTVSAKGKSTVSTKGKSTVSTKGKSTVSTKGKSTVSTKGKSTVSTEKWDKFVVTVYTPRVTEENPLGTQFRAILNGSETIRSGMFRYEIFRMLASNGVPLAKLRVLKTKTSGRGLPNYLRPRLTEFKTTWDEVASAGALAHKNFGRWFNAVAAEKAERDAAAAAAKQ